MRFFLWNEVVDRAPIRAVYSSAKFKWLYMFGKGLLIAYILVPNVIGTLEARQYHDDYLSTRRAIKPFGGEFEIETFIMNGEEIGSDTLVTRRWKKLLINGRSADIQSLDGATINWMCHASLNNNRIMLISPDLSTTGNFNFKEEGKTLTMEGIFYNDTIKVVATRKSENPFLLVDRGFHWVNESPFNR